ncbi:LuxR family two component transcriptional regulator [Kribbella pratensis]|jgi:DNA-binding NarL/FixJ family response regulator|uniref:LuxR family two component transcriptional regulator n=1 Tax=Kribbella pratensis TaxID=2512112 RepID=A0ABY2FIV5_9ACTN|nr:response regulator transcription factor [Kribbella pratensis]TDW93051.1 LuxR family two component transcriptional regulator [Kribbella pratensis]
MDEPVRVLLADDHPVYRDGLAALLGSLDGVEVVGTAADGVEAVDGARELQPDVVVMDVQMPRLDGIEATRAITADSPHIGVVVLTMAEEDQTLFAAMRAGARGYLLKGASQGEIVRAITAVAQGEAIFGPAIARRVAEFFAAAPAATPGSAFPQLTSREHEILALVAAGRSNAQIASELYLSPKTVRNNVSNIFTKLHVADRAEAIIRARDAGLGR